MLLKDPNHPALRSSTRLIVPKSERVALANHLTDYDREEKRGRKAMYSRDLHAAVPLMIRWMMKTTTAMPRWETTFQTRMWSEMGTTRRRRRTMHRSWAVMVFLLSFI